jgi:hypothetical protein
VFPGKVATGAAPTAAQRRRSSLAASGSGVSTLKAAAAGVGVVGRLRTHKVKQFEDRTTLGHLQGSGSGQRRQTELIRADPAPPRPATSSAATVRDDVPLSSQHEQARQSAPLRTHSWCTAY